MSNWAKFLGTGIIIFLFFFSIGFCEDENQLFVELKKQYRLTDAQTYELMGMTHLEMDRVDRAEFYFKKTVTLDPRLYRSWYNLGLINMDNPEIFFKKAIEANRNFAPAHYWLASYYDNCDNRIEATKYFREYLNVVDRNDPLEKQRI